MRLFEGTPLDRPPRCEVCGELDEACVCPPPEPQWLAPEKQTARLAIENRKKGKRVTVIRGLAAGESDLPELLRKLKTGCGAGGTLDGEDILIQGDQLDKVRELLTASGYRVKG